MKLQAKHKKTLIIAGLALAAAAAAYYLWHSSQPQGPGEGFVSGNGRIEATELNASSKLPGRVTEVLVNEGDFVKAGQPLVRMDIASLNAQLDEARAYHQQAVTGVSNAQAMSSQRSSDEAAARAAVVSAESDLDAARRKLRRTEVLAREGASSMQELDDDRARVKAAQAQVNAAKARQVAAQAATVASRTQIDSARSAVDAAAATMKRIETEVADSVLVAPRDARVQYRIVQPNEVLGAGSPALNMIDLNDVYMTFFIPEQVAGRVAIGSEARIVLDTAPDYPIPAKISFVASSAQFTPKTVETASERQKLMFRIKAQISPELLQQYPEQVKIGLPGVAWIKLDPNAAWPASLAPKTRP